MSDEGPKFKVGQQKHESNQSRANDSGGPDQAKDGPAEEDPSMINKHRESHKCTGRRTGIKTTSSHSTWRQVYHLMGVDGYGHD